MEKILETNTYINGRATVDDKLVEVQDITVKKIESDGKKDNIFFKFEVGNASDVDRERLFNTKMFNMIVSDESDNMTILRECSVTGLDLKGDCKDVEETL